MTQYCPSWVLTAATVNMSKTFVQYRQAFAFPYFVWHSSARQKCMGWLWTTEWRVGLLRSNSDGSWFRFTVKAINLCNLSALVVSTQECNPVWPLGLQHQKVGEGLQTVVPPVDKVPLKEVYTWKILTDAYKSNGLDERQIKCDFTLQTMKM